MKENKKLRRLLRSMGTLLLSHTIDAEKTIVSRSSLLASISKGNIISTKEFMEMLINIYLEFEWLKLMTFDEVDEDLGRNVSRRKISVYYKIKLAKPKGVNKGQMALIEKSDYYGFLGGEV